jgi:hypothetical protein
MNTSSRTTWWLPRVALDPPPGWDGGGDVVEPPGELDEPPGLDADDEDDPPGDDPLDPDEETRNSGGVEKGSRPANWATGVGVIVALGVGTAVGLGDVGPVAAVGASPPPNKSFDPRNNTSKTPTAIPPYFSVLLSLSEIGIATPTPPSSVPAQSPAPRSCRSCRSARSPSA